MADSVGVIDRGNPGTDGLGIIAPEPARNPKNTEGREGELFLNTRSQVMFKKVAGRWVSKFRLKGEPGPPGLRGYSVRSGDHEPTAAIGRDGDVYIQMVSSTDVEAPAMWGPKINGAWGTNPVPLRGTQGPQGLGWYSGAGVPSNGLGEDDELYFRTDGSVYIKGSGVWALAVSLVGPQGPQGDPGATGNTGPAALLPIAAWVTGGNYVAGPPASFVHQNGSAYECLIPHAAGDFATDLGAGKWGLVAQKGADGLGTGNVSHTGAGPFAGRMAVFDAVDGTTIRAEDIPAGGGGSPGAPNFMM